MTERPTEAMDTVTVGPPGPWAGMLRYWARFREPSITRQWVTRMSGPWGRYALAVAVGMLFVVRPTTWPTLALCGLMGVVASWSRHNRFILVIPAIVFGFAWGSGEAAVAALGMLLAGDWWARRAARPDPLAMRIHLRAARLTGAPTQEEYLRRESFMEARDRIITFGRGKGGANPLYRTRKVEKRHLDPIRQKWVRVDAAPPDAWYPHAGLYLRYPASFNDDDPDRRAELTQAVAAKLPPGPDGHPVQLIAPCPPPPDAAEREPGWRTSEDWVYLKPARPLPRWVNLENLPAELPWKDVVPFGRVSPDSPLAAFPDGPDGPAVACWNPDNQACPVPLTPGVVVAGPPGSYKTAAARTLIHGAREHLGAEFGGAHILAIDGKREGAFNYLKGQHNCVVVTDPAQAKAQLKATVEEMRARYATNEARRDAKLPLAVYQPRVVVIDEGMSLLDQLANDPEITDIMTWIVDIGRLGRLARCFPIWLTQRPDVRGIQNFGTVGQLRDMLELKLGGAGLSETGGRMIYGDSNGKLVNQIPKTPRARMGMMVGSDFTLVQLAWTPDPLGPSTDEPGPLIASARDLTDSPADPPAPAMVIDPEVVTDPQLPRRHRTMTP